MGATEEVAAVLWVDMYVMLSLSMHDGTVRILLQWSYENHALLLHCARKSHNKYCSGNVAKTLRLILDKNQFAFAMMIS